MPGRQRNIPVGYEILSVDSGKIVGCVDRVA